MKTLIALWLALGGAARPSDGTLQGLATSAEERLARSIADLDRLRTEIAAEKLPLAQELTALEERLAGLRREHDLVTRSVDEGNLELTTRQQANKARQDELAYVGNLLDEYARTFETKVHVSELQRCGLALVEAKQATENTTLTMLQRFERQLAFVSLSLDRLVELVGGMRFPGVGVSLTGAVADGQFAIIGPVALFRDTSGATAGLAIPQSGSDKPIIRPLEGALQAGLAALVQTGEGFLPLDPSRGGALKELVEKFNIVHVFKKGGPIMWPLLVASVIALATVFERLFFLFLEKLKRDPRALERFFAAVSRGDTDEAIGIGKTSRYYVVRALGYALAHKEGSLANALSYAQGLEMKRFQRGISVLDTVITLAPLLGLLGTVTGMMGSFSLIGGELSSPGAITGGIAEALIATAFGLGIAITALLPFNFLNTRNDQARHELESASTQLQLMVEPTLAGTVNGAHAERAPVDTQRELRKKRDALRRQMEELQSELEEHELEIRQHTERARTE